jgi:sporulation protein YlmC with PRC-barrel domain
MESQKREHARSEARNLNVTKDLKGMIVLNTATGEKLGEVTDAIIHPTEGRMIGIALRTPEGEIRALPAENLLIGVHAVMVAKEARFEMPGHSDKLTGGVPAHDLVGTNVVTGDGKLLGRVSEVYISTEQPKVFYHIAESALQRFFGGGFYIAGNLPRAYSPDGMRMIVPDDTENSYAVPSLAEAIQGR